MDNETLISFEPEHTRKKLNLRDSIFKYGLGRTLFMTLFLIALVPVSIIAIISYQYIAKISQQNQYQQLNTAIEIQKKAITRYIDDLSETLKSQSELLQTQYFLRDLQDSYKASRATLAKFVKSSQWTHINRLYQSDMRYILNSNPILDVYLVSVDGDILYSSAEKNDLGLNVNSKNLHSSHFTKTINRNLKSGRLQFSDINFYKYFNSEPAAFISQTVVDTRGKLLGAIVAQIDLHEIENILGSNLPHTSSLKIYLLGQDGFLRNDLHKNDLTRLTLKINSRATDHWLNNIGSPYREPGKRNLFRENYQNVDKQSVLGVYQSLNIGGIKWALFAEISQHEAMENVDELLHIFIAVVIFTLMITVSVSLYLTRQVVNPLACLVEWARNISHGKLDMTYIITHEKEIDQLNSALIDIVKFQRQTCETIALISDAKVMSDAELGIEVNSLVTKFDVLCNELAGIAQGEYNHFIGQLHDNEVNPPRFKQISRDLAQSFSNVELHRWLAEGKYNLFQCTLKHESDMPLLEAHQHSLQLFATEFIVEISRYLQASVGLVYLADENNVLILTGHYAFSEQANTSKRFEIGEGVIGQVALQTQAIRINATQGEHVDIDIGAGKISAKTVIACPFFYANDIAGVIELVFSDQPENRVELYLQNISSLAGSMFHEAELFDRLITLSSQALNQNNILTTENSSLESHNNILSQRLLAQKQELLLYHNNNRDTFTPIVTDDLSNETKSTEQFSSSAYIENISAALRTPLKRMLVLSQALTENNLNNLNKEQLESARVIHRSGKELLNLVSDIYHLDQLEKNDPPQQKVLTNIPELCEILRQEFTESTQQKLITLLFHINTNVPKTFHGNQDIIYEIIRHIIIDAIKYTSSGSISLTVALDDSEQHQRSPDNSDNTVIFSISDTGMSIPTDEINHIFENKKSDDKSVYRDSRGASIGLVISKRLSNLLGGDIKFNSKYNGGCQFEVIIPMGAVHSVHVKENTVLDEDVSIIEIESKTTLAANTHNPLPSVNIATTHNTGIILIVDDDKTRVEHLQKIFATSIFQCFVTESGDKLETLAKLHNPVAIILDENISNIDGSLVTTTVSSSLQLKSIAIYIYSHDGHLRRFHKPVTDRNVEIYATLDSLFNDITLTSNDSIKHILLVEKDINYQQSISNTIEDALIKITIADTATAAFNLLQENAFDCVILELALPDLSGDRLLERVALSDNIILPPVIIYTGKDLNEREHRCVSRYSDAIIRKGDKAHRLLKQEINAHLYTSESNLPPAMRQRVEMIHSEQQIMNEKSALLVDDDFLLTYPLSTALKQCGMRVVVANNGEHCLDLLQSSGPFDIIIMDVLLPVMNGVDAIKAIRAVPLHVDLPIIALTSKATQQDRLACCAAGASDYITKPIDINALLSVMQIWLTSSEQKNVNNAA